MNATLYSSVMQAEKRLFLAETLKSIEAMVMYYVPSNRECLARFAIDQGIVEPITST